MNKADSSRALLILALICTAYLLIPFHRMTPSIMSAAIMAETGMGPVMIGFLSSILFLTFGIMQMVGGLLVDSYGPRRILPCFLLAATAGTALFALSTSAPGLLLGRAIIGFGTSVIFVSGLKLFNAWFPPTVYARLNGLLLGMGGLGLVIGSGGMGYLCDGLGWRTSHLIVALITFCFALALAWIVRDTPGHASRPTPAGRAGAAPLALLGHILRNRQFLFIAGWFCCQFSLHNAFGGLWGGQYLRAIHHLDTVTTGNVLNMLGIGTLLGSLANAWLCDRFFPHAAHHDAHSRGSVCPAFCRPHLLGRRLLHPRPVRLVLPARLFRDGLAVRGFCLHAGHLRQRAAGNRQRSAQHPAFPGRPAPPTPDGADPGKLRRCRGQLWPARLCGDPVALPCPVGRLAAVCACRLGPPRTAGILK